MTDVNAVTLVGRLTRDAELRHANSGTAILSFSIAVNRYAGKDKGEEASFFDVTLFGNAASAVAKYATKGKQVAVSGELKQDRWEKDGQKHSKVTIQARNMQLLGGKGGESKDDFADDVDF